MSSVTHLIEPFTSREALKSLSLRLGWKVFLSLSLLFVVLISGYLIATGHYG